MNKIQVIKKLRNGAGNVAARQSTCLQHGPGLASIPSTAINQPMEHKKDYETQRIEWKANIYLLRVPEEGTERIEAANFLKETNDTCSQVLGVQHKLKSKLHLENPSRRAESYRQREERNSTTAKGNSGLIKGKTNHKWTSSQGSGMVLSRWSGEAVYLQFRSLAQTVTPEWGQTKKFSTNEKNSRPYLTKMNTGI